ncbi:hypothetical protein MSG28_015656 [Choristoneura fumiferana]|uniref:Uncharacterized protein n=1 Tax=Choristoneura fumiferana TaxID=7141 RepID=A0ACC0KAZ8_CHOFU|nr:hypothetical protein MSG28_015656 [Choristoneura fumiferana]
MGWITLLLSGLPAYVTLEDLGYYLECIFTTNSEIGFDAIAAQEQLDGYRYQMQDGVQYILRAKITNKKEYLRSDTSPEFSLSSRNSSEEKENSSAMSISSMSDVAMLRANAKLNAKYKLLKKQKLIVEAQMELIRERRKLRREFARRWDKDFEKQSLEIKSKSNSPDRSLRRYKIQEVEKKSRVRSRAVRSRSIVNDVDNTSVKTKIATKEPKPDKYSSKHTANDKSKDLRRSTNIKTKTDMLNNSDATTYINVNYRTQPSNWKENIDSSDKKVDFKNNPLEMKQGNADRKKSRSDETMIRLICDDIMFLMKSLLLEISIKENIVISDRTNEVMIEKLNAIVQERVKIIYVEKSLTIYNAWEIYRKICTKEDDILLLKTINEDQVIELISLETDIENKATDTTEVLQVIDVETYCPKESSIKASEKHKTVPANPQFVLVIKRLMKQLKATLRKSREKDQTTGHVYKDSTSLEHINANTTINKEVQRTETEFFEINKDCREEALKVTAITIMTSESELHSIAHELENKDATPKEEIELKEEIEPELTDEDIEKILSLEYIGLGIDLHEYNTSDPCKVEFPQVGSSGLHGNYDGYNTNDTCDKETPQVTSITIMTSTSELLSLKLDGNGNTVKEVPEVKVENNEDVSNETAVQVNENIENEAFGDVNEIVSSITNTEMICPESQDKQAEDDEEETIESICKYPCKKLIAEMKEYIEQDTTPEEKEILIKLIRAALRKNLAIALDGKGYMRAAEVTKLYREKHPKTGDEAFVKKILANIRASYLPDELEQKLASVKKEPKGSDDESPSGQKEVGKGEKSLENPSDDNKVGENEDKQEVSEAESQDKTNEENKTDADQTDFSVDVNPDSSKTNDKLVRATTEELPKATNKVTAEEPDTTAETTEAKYGDTADEPSKSEENAESQKTEDVALFSNLTFYYIKKDKLFNSTLSDFSVFTTTLFSPEITKNPMPGPGPQQNQNFNQPHTDYRGNDYNDSRPSPWGQQQPQPNQWAPNPMGQGPQNNFGYQGQGPSMQNQYIPPQQQMTIMKDNFQGPSEYNLGQGPAPQAGQPWMQQQQQQKPPAFTDPKRPPIKPQGSDSFKDYDKDFEPLSPDRHMRESPFRKASPGRGSPRRYSPGRRSPPRRSPGRRMSPGRRSPGRRGSPGPRPLEHERRSPGRMGPGIRNRKGVMIELLLTAANQAMYPGGYRPNAHEKVKYPIQGQRPVETRDSPWQQERDKAMFNEVLKKREEERSARMPFERPGLRLDKDQRSHSPRKSRSPLRRDTSPSRDRYKRHSPSPRSPRRSWALEKRRSPDLGEAPPPPIWPGQASRDEKRPDFADVETKRKPVWDYKKDISDTRRPEDDRRFPAPEGIRVRRDLGPIVPPEHREELEFKPHDRFPRDGPKFSPRDDFDKKVPKFNPRDDFDKKVGPKFSPRDDFEKKGPKFSPRDDFEKKGPKFSPRDDFEKKGPKFSPRDDFDKKGPKFSPRDDFDKRPKFSPRDDFIKVPKFSPRDDYQEPKVSRDDLMRKDPKFGHDIDRPKFSPRDDYEDRRDDIRKHDLSDWKPREIPLKPPERDVYRGDFPKRDEPSRIELRRDVLRKMSEELDKQFEDVHKRAQDFHKRAEEYRRDDRKREYERGPPQPKPFEDRHHDEDRRDFRIEERRKEDWNTDEHLKNKAIIIAAIKAKKEKATQEISQKILDKHNIDAEAPQNSRICEELRVSVGKLINEMFGDNDVSFIELVIKFNAKYSGAGEDKILRDVMASFPSQFRPKRSAPEYAEVPAKRSRRTPEPDLNKEWDMTRAPEPAPSYGMYPPSMHPMTMGPPMHPMMMGPPMMVPAPMFPPLQEPQQEYELQSKPVGYNLYLCKDDFEPFSELQADYLRQFLINQIIGVTEISQGWAPDFTFKGLQSSCRFELHTNDEMSKDWLVNFDFSIFILFNILVYTNEELWYERAAIWLPGHSRYRNIEPLTKLKLQNKKLEGANVGKWKFVKKIVTTKGTRVYVDMPPSAARALEKHKMTLSYELQKVNVFLKAVAIDKDAFDIGLKDPSITDESEIKNAVMNSPMPSIGKDPKIVKIGLAGNKPLTILQACKVREMLIYKIFKYHQEDGRSSTDFTKHGFVSPGYLGVLPENAESKRWLTGVNIGKLNKQSIIILGSDESNTRYIDMSIVIPSDSKVNCAKAFERIKQSNKGVKGLYFSKWKPKKLVEERSKSKYRFEVDIDIESVETIVSMKYMLDYVDDVSSKCVHVKYKKSERHLLETIKKYKLEFHDTYDDANMDLASSDSENEDIVFLG